MRYGMVAVLGVAALMVTGRNAEAQARGTLQATATVVDTRQGFEALSLVRQSLRDARTATLNPVTTVAQISTAHPANDPQTLVVTIDYSRN
ncbi:MAG: hypothetical protein ABR537_12660 [Gemmatimonadales bacterium]